VAISPAARLAPAYGGPVPPERTDEELIVLVASGDREAFAMLWRRFAPAVITLASRFMGEQAAAEDVAQEVFTSVWRSARRYEPSRGAAAPWIFTIARNASRDALRRRKPVASGEVPEVVDSGPGPAEEALSQMQAFEVHAAVAALPDGSRELIELAYYDGLSQSEIAARRGIPLGTVKTRTRTALATLAERLASQREVAHG
jgi:RNA polymerase sigma-70 factor (ECF subfamily)